MTGVVINQGEGLIALSNLEEDKIIFLYYVICLCVINTVRVTGRHNTGSVIKKSIDMGNLLEVICYSIGIKLSDGSRLKIVKAIYEDLGISTSYIGSNNVKEGKYKYMLDTLLLMNIVGCNDVYNMVDHDKSIKVVVVNTIKKDYNLRISSIYMRCIETVIDEIRRATGVVINSNSVVCNTVYKQIKDIRYNRDRFND